MQRWWLTATAHTVASAAGGMAIGVVLGAAGHALAAVPASTRLVLLGIATGSAATLDAGAFGRRVPTWHRQVDERWLVTYRGWVYGAGFGAQLGVGVATIVTSAATYAAFAAAVLSASWQTGLLIGAVFGGTRGVPLLLMARVRSADRLHAVTRRIAAAEPRVRRATILGQGALAAGALVAAGVT